MRVFSVYIISFSFLNSVVFAIFNSRLLLSLSLMTLNFLVRSVSFIPLMSRLLPYAHTSRMYFIECALSNALLHSLDTLARGIFDFDKSSRSIRGDGMHNRFGSLVNSQIEIAE